ncbi:histidine phosphatase family protein [Primorskyibacter flagellatus]|uniref:histidine phosphatase family protein n=1 Tax=Primorskyibacter flagellatus TaxID=1387277 RepID=UPI003A9563BC
MAGKNAPLASLILIRHAPIAEQGRLFGRTDAPACLDAADIPGLRRCLGGVAQVISSPARRCRQTAAAIWDDGRDIPADARLWEQSFGDHEGLAYAELPDLGPLGGADLAAYTPPKGESFNAVCARAWPALQELAERAHAIDGPIALVVHAGIVRAAIAQVIEVPSAALSFEVAPLSLSRFRVGPAGLVAISSVNETAR